MDINTTVQLTLDSFYAQHRIPNIIFHGKGHEKNTIVDKFIDKIYAGDLNDIHRYVKQVDCSYGKGIKFIREDIKFFAQSNIHTKHGTVFKVILLYNADKLTIDAQSALRRCIELFAQSTRIFMVVDDRSKLMCPILSRFCSIFVHTSSLKTPISNDQIKRFVSARKKKIASLMSGHVSDIISNVLLVNKLIELGYSATDIIFLIYDGTPKNVSWCVLNKDQIINHVYDFYKFKSVVKHEKTIMLFTVNCIFLGLECSINMSTSM